MDFFHFRIRIDRIKYGQKFNASALEWSRVGWATLVQRQNVKISVTTQGNHKGFEVKVFSLKKL